MHQGVQGAAIQAALQPAGTLRLPATDEDDLAVDKRSARSVRQIIKDTGPITADGIETEWRPSGLAGSLASVEHAVKSGSVRLARGGAVALLEAAEAG